MKSGTVFNVQKFSVNDGPGIRTTVFLKGCPLNCIWCHNPESKNKKREFFYNANKCLGCRLCEQKCANSVHSFTETSHTLNRENCVLCGECSVCPSAAIEFVGEEKTSDEVISEVLRDKVFYDNSGGGMTLSGGEPMFQFDFSLDLLKKARENSIHTAIETCGFAPLENYRKIAPYVDLFLFDYKESNSEKHKEFTGVANELIIENLRLLDSLGCKIILRCPIIPGLNDRADHFKAIASISQELENIIEINVEPYHPLGKSKSEQLDKDYPLDELGFTDDKIVAEWIECISSCTTVPVKKA